MVALMACAFGMIACYALGVLGLISMLVTTVCRYYLLGPPDSLLFIMAASIGVYTPAPLELPVQPGWWLWAAFRPS